MTPPITLLIVNYRSAELTSRAIASARSSTGARLHVIVVDNTVDPAEEKLLRRLDSVDVRIAPENLGYARAINSALADIRGRTVVISNPDVEFDPGCIEGLAASLAPDVAAAGPRFFWDEERRWMLPPPETMSFGEQLAGAWLSPRLWERGRRQLRLEFWQASSTISVPVLSGAVLAVNSDTFRELGGMDERFQLYFEEVDYARRARKSGRRMLHVPMARCRHMYDQSASIEPKSGQWFEDSRRRFNRKWFGRLGARALDIRFGDDITGDQVGERPIPSAPVPGGTLIELSPTPDFRMAAGMFTEGETVEPPGEALEQSRFERVWFRAVDPSRLRTLWTTRLERSRGW